MKIQEIVQILTTFKSQVQEKSRSAYIDELSSLITTYYEYNTELADYFVSLFPPAELVNFLEASQSSRPMVIRTNTLRTRRRELAQTLIQKGVNLDPVGDWNKVGLKIIDSQVPIGATTEYLAGHYMLQSASSFLPVMALAPRPGERVLDLCAAPGGKTTHIGQLMKNTGIIVANEMNPDRVASVKGNVHRMGLTNVIITNYDGRKIGKHLAGFDRALVDAPCSGLGVIWKDPSVKSMRTLKDIKRNAHIQKELLLSAIDAVNSKSSHGGYIVYSTCSVSVEENEEVVNYALKNRKVKLVDTGLTIGEPGMHKFKGKIFHPSLKLCKRIYPHVYNMEGFFVAKLRKIDNNISDTASKPHSGLKRDKKNKKNKGLEQDEDTQADHQENTVEKVKKSYKKHKKIRENDENDLKITENAKEKTQEIEIPSKRTKPRQKSAEKKRKIE
jgi:25S rRNA (cytosine2870-C5)-methyltransferase